MDHRDSRPDPKPARRRASRARTRNGLTPEQRRQQRRDALVDAGLELFGTKGYNSTSVEEVCRTAYVSTRNFYEEFDNREALLWHLVYETMAEAYAALRGGDGWPGAGRHELRDRIAAMVHAFADDPRRARLVFVECRGMSLLQEHRRRAAQQGFAQLLASLIEERAGAAVLTDKTRGTFALAIVGAVDLIVSDWVLQPERPSLDELIDSLVEVVSWMGSGAVAMDTAAR